MIPLFSHAAGKLTDSKAVQSTVIEASTHLKQELTRELKQSIGLDEFVLKVELRIDEKKLQQTLGVNEEDWKKLEGLSLPGLFVEGKEGLADSPVRQVKKEDILMSLRGVKIDLVFYQSNYTPEFLTGALKKIVAFNVPQLTDSQIEIVPAKAEATYRPTGHTAEETIIKAFNKPLDVKMIKSEFENFWNAYYKPILLGAAAIVLALGFIVAFALRGSLGNLAEVIKTKTFGSTSSQSAAPVARAETPAQSYKQDSQTDTFESYMQANEYLSTMVNRESKVFNEVIILKLMAEDFVSLTILLDVLPKEKRDIFLANLDQSKKERFKEFIVGHGTSVLKDETLLKEEAIKMIKLVKVASLSPDELYQIVMRDMVTSMGTQELSTLMKASAENERAFMCDQLESSQLAFMVQSESLSPEDLELEATVLTKAEMVDLLIKASSIRGFKKTKIRKEKLESVYAQVETDKAEVLADAMGLSPNLRFEFLFTSFKDSALKYLEGMDFDGLSLLYPLLTESMRKEVLASLPELMAERLKFAKKKINADSLRLKGDFYFYLRSHSDTEEDVGSFELKSAA